MEQNIADIANSFLPAIHGNAFEADTFMDGFDADADSPAVAKAAQPVQSAHAAKAAPHLGMMQGQSFPGMMSAFPKMAGLTPVPLLSGAVPEGFQVGGIQMPTQDSGISLCSGVCNVLSPLRMRGRVN